MRHVLAGAAVALGIAAAAPAFADDGASLEARLARAEQELAASSSPSAREIQSAVDAYLASGKADAALVGGPGEAGYDGGFWIRGGSFLLKTNLTLQTRYEYWDWDQRSVEPSPGGDLSGFSVPRATLRLSGDATCDVHYYVALEFGHPGSLHDNEVNRNTESNFFIDSNGDPINHAADAGNTLREGWIEYGVCTAFAARMGLVQTPNTRQMMTPPELQQFVDISLASVFTGLFMPGYTDRNRDYGLLLHGAFLCDQQLSYMLSVTNGDGPASHNVVDGTTNDNLAYGARLNYDIKGHMGYEEGALRQSTCGWVASVGAWAYVYHDTLTDNPHQSLATRTLWGLDAAFGWGGFSFTAAYTDITLDNSDFTPATVNSYSYLVQAGYLLPNTSWEIAARYSGYQQKYEQVGGATFGAAEIAGAVTYYVDGHADKLTLDVAFVQGEDDGNIVADAYAGYNAGIKSNQNGTFTSDGMLVRFQWQLAL